MQINVESTPVVKFEPIEITIKVRVEKPSELLSVLEDEERLDRSHLCNEKGDPLSEVANGVVKSLVKKVTETLE